MTSTYATPTSTQNATLVRRAIEENDLSAFAPGYAFHGPPEVFQADCPSAGTAIHEHANPFDHGGVRIDDVEATEDRVVVRFEGSGVHRAPYRGVAPTGRRRAAQVLAVYRIEQGRIAEGWGTISWD